MTIRPRHFALQALLTFALLSASATSGCVGFMPRRRAPTIGDGTRPTATSVVGSPSIGLSSKAVYGMREPVTLVSQDRTECVVSEKKFKETSIGEKVRCDWRAP